MNRNLLIDKPFNFLLSEKSKDTTEYWIIWISIASFAIHLLLILLNNFEVINLGSHSGLFENPISAIYTPFSFILLFEVYLLVYHIPQSTSNYIAKQYEIITLIVVRRLFKDISHIDLTTDWFSDPYDLQFTYDIVTTLILFLLIYYFHKLNSKGPEDVSKTIAELPEKVRLFINRKKLLAICLVPIVFMMSVYSFGNWTFDVFSNISHEGSKGISDINSIFFDEFFVLLILTDVLLLLFSFFHTSQFNIFIRNSGFIISTILLRISFGVDGYLNNILITVAVLFGVLILLINKKYEGFEKS